MPQLFGEKLRSARQQRGLTQAQLAEQVGLASRAHIANLEAGRDVPSLSLVISIGRILRVSIDYLLRDTISVGEVREITSGGESSQSEERFGTRLRTLRLHHGWGQTELARRLGLARRGSISQFENSYKLPSIEVIIKLCEVFEITADELFNHISL